MKNSTPADTGERNGSGSGIRKEAKPDPVSIRFRKGILRKLVSDAMKNHRTLTGQIEMIVEEHYR